MTQNFSLSTAVILIAGMAALIFPVHHVDAQPTMAAQSPAPANTRMRDVLMSLSPAGRKLFVEGWLNPEHTDSIETMVANHAQQDRVFAAMSAEPFDAEALRIAYVDERALSAKRQRTRQERLTSILKQLKPSDRHIVVGRLLAIRAQKERKP